MSKIRGLYRRAGQKEWSYDFTIRGHRFCGATQIVDKREAEKWVKAFREKCKADIDQLDGVAPMSLAAAASRYWTDKGQHRKDAKQIAAFIDWIQTHMSPSTLVYAIDNNALSLLIARRRVEGVSPATVNRSVTEPMRAILRHAAFLGQKVKPIEWGRLLLKEAPPIVTEISPEREAELIAAMREDFRPLLRFLVVTGVRLSEACYLKWPDVDLTNGMVTIHGKGGTLDRRPLADAAIAILRGERGRHPERVFTYVIRHRNGGVIGDRAPIEPDAIKLAWWRALKRAGLKGTRLHDLRHTALSRVTREGGIAAAQRAAGHARITTTQRYVHVTDEDLRDALNRAAPVAREVKEQKA